MMDLRKISFGRIAILAGAAFVAACSVPPEPLTQAELDATAADRETRIISPDQAPVTGPIDLYEAMARAIKYNLDHQVELKEEALRFEELDLSEYDMLPDLVANAEYTGRSNTPGASSVSILTGTQSLEPSRSTDRNVLAADLTLSWDILDFGLSYVRAQQEADEVMIAMEQRRSAINRIIEDVRTAYWRAVSAERLLARLEALQGDVEGALAASEAQVANRVGPPIEALTYQRELLTIIRAVQELRRDLGVAKNQLAALMNLPQNQTYQVVVPSVAEMDLPTVEAAAEDLAKMAFRNRAELREITYRLRINDKEFDVAILEALPSLRGFLGLNASTNDFLFNQNWVAYGAQASWNLMNIVRYPQREKTIEAGNALLDARALALTQAIATQVFVSKARVLSLREELGTAKKLSAVNTEISRQTTARVRAGASGRRVEVQERLSSILADLRRDVTYADLQNAYANLYASVGLDVYAPNLEGDEPVKDMAAALRLLWFERGDAFAGRKLDLSGSVAASGS